MLSLQAIRGTFHRLMYVLKETRLRKTILLFLMSLMAVSGIAQKRKLERLPYIDQRRIHFGFSVGLHTQDLGFTHTDIRLKREKLGMPKSPLSLPVLMSGWLATFIFINILTFASVPPCILEIRRSNFGKIIQMNVVL